MSTLGLTWTLQDHGWAVCEMADDNSAVEVVASYVTDGPEQFLTAVAQLVSGASVAQADLQAEPVVHRWVFRRRASDVEITLLRVPPDSVAWTSVHSVDALARAAVRTFDDVAYRHGEDGYERLWGRPFPATELHALRKAWRRTSELWSPGDLNP